MTDLPPAPPAAPPPPRLSDEFRSLRRSRSDRVIAGVLGGLGRRLGIDPVVLRIVTAVLAIFGGVGILLYATAWLLVPAEDEEGSVLDHALGRGEDRRASAAPLALFLAVVSVATAISIIVGSWDSGVLALLAAIGLYALLRRRNDPAEADDGSDVPAADTSEQTSPVQGTAVASDSADTAATDTATDAGAPTSTAVGTEPMSSADLVSPGWPEGPDWGPPSPPVPEPAMPPTPQRRPRSILGPLTFCAALIAVGVLAVNDVSWASFPPALYVAVPLGIVGLGLLIGAWYGRSRGLIVLGLLLAVALVPATWVSQWDLSNVGDASYRYTTIDEVPTGPVEHGAGNITYDLSQLRLTDADTVPLSLEIGAGDVEITVPQNADVTVQASVGAGGYDMFGQSSDGVGADVSTTDHGRDGPGGGAIVLDVELGVGQLEVNR